MPEGKTYSRQDLYNDLFSPLPPFPDADMKEIERQAG